MGESQKKWWALSWQSLWRSKQWTLSTGLASCRLTYLPSAPPLTTLSPPSLATPPPSRHTHSTISSCDFKLPRNSREFPGGVQFQISRTPESDATSKFCSSESQRLSLIPAEVLVLCMKRLGHCMKSSMDLKTQMLPSHTAPVREELQSAKLPSVKEEKRF